MFFISGGLYNLTETFILVFIRLYRLIKTFIPIFIYLYRSTETIDLGRGLAVGVQAKVAPPTFFRPVGRSSPSL